MRNLFEIDFPEQEFSMKNKFDYILVNVQNESITSYKRYELSVNSVQITATCSIEWW
jgi:hypothetical protein